ncbi:MAG: methyltransferase domain-containing protein, partial [Verrucomicrobia bacterium]|nr:methyltransferase domain-containing protein [Verrucomicrobiota bacterium]
MDLGCAVGRSSFGLSKNVPEVVGVDFSKTFIRAAQTLAQQGSIRFPIKLEGALTQIIKALAPQKKCRSRVRFRTGDALKLPALGKFDLVLVANLVDRVKDPGRLLKNILPSLIRPGGLLLLTSPYTWSTEFTPRARWLRNSFSLIQKLLSPHFRLIRRQDLPFLLREHRRKF